MTSALPNAESRSPDVNPAWPSNGDESHHGYPKLSRFMSSRPDNAIFRRFNELNALHLLRLQAEIQDLERQLHNIRAADSASNDLNRMAYSSDFRLMRKDVEDAARSDITAEVFTDQYDIIVEIGEKLQEYNAALALTLKLNKADDPDRRGLENLREWLKRPNAGNNFLKGAEARIWEEKDLSEYISLSPPVDEDLISSFINGRLLDFYHLIWGDRRITDPTVSAEESVFREYSRSKIDRVSSIVGASLSSLLPTLAILVLYFVDRMVIRIGLVILFTTMFSTALAVLTTAKKVEIFSATAAFAAVEVVFIGSTDRTK